MRDFALRAGRFATLALALYVLMELSARWLFGPTLSAIKLSMPTDAPVIVLGNSHPFAGLDPARLSRPALNLADNSRTIYYDRLIFERLSARTDTLILGLDFFSLGLDKPENELDYLAAGYPPRQGVSLMQRLELHSALLRYRTQYPGRLLSMRPVRAAFTSGSVPPEGPGIYLMQNGWLAMNGVQAAEMTPEHGLRVVQRHLSDYSPEVRAVFLPMLEDLVARAVERRMRVLIVVCPASPDYRRWVADDVLRAFAEDLRAVSRPYRPDQVGVLWRYDDPGYGPDMFHNVDHLSTRGAERFSAEVEAYLNR